jgi:hypothetical protein
MSDVNPQCPQCGADLSNLALSVNPLFDLKVAAMLIPMRYPSLKKFLCLHKAAFPPRYRLAGDRRRRRLLSASEIKTIRCMVIRGPDRPTFDEILMQFDTAVKFREGGAPAVTGDPLSLP